MSFSATCVLTCVHLCAAAGAPSSGTVGSLESKAKTLLGLEWQYWAAIIAGLGGVLLLFYCTKDCCPFWSWTKTLVRLAWFVLKCGCKCGWCLLKLMPRGDAPDAVRKEEVLILPLFFLGGFYTAAHLPGTTALINSEAVQIIRLLTPELKVRCTAT